MYKRQGSIVLISKYILVKTLRKLAENMNLKPKTIGNIAGDVYKRQLFTLTERKTREEIIMKLPSKEAKEVAKACLLYTSRSV